MKECSNKKVEENKPALKFNFTLEFNWGGMFLNNFDSQRALMHNAHGLSQAVQFGIEYYSWTITLLKID